MTAPRCPIHDVSLELDEVTDEERAFGGLDWQATESYVVERWVCPIVGCRSVRELAGSGR